MDQTMNSYHEPVLANECVQVLAPAALGIVVDGTFGGGGHTRRLLDAYPEIRIIGIDRDPDAIANTPNDPRVQVVLGNFAEIERILHDELGISPDVSGTVDGVLLDLGISSHQVDAASRGFSYHRSGPIDMRMDQTSGQTAADLVNTASEQELADMIYRYGEERSSRRIARAIVEARAKMRIETTAQLAGIVERAKGGRKGKKIHPATKTFQALRMAVNEELDSIEQVLEQMVDRVVDGGRIVILTFHSLEDRLVKQFFNRHVPREESLQQGGVRRVYEEPPVKCIWKKPLKASEEEQSINPRSRSAKLRAVEIGT